MTLRRTATLLAAALIFVFGLFTGFRLLTSQADTTVAGPTCTDRTVKEGDRLTSNLVIVNVLNASQRSGLANRVAIDLQRRGFLEGSIGNSASKVKASTVTILTEDRKDPRVRLVARQFDHKVSYAKPDIQLEDGVTVVIGDDYDKLKKGRSNAVASNRDVTICVPVIPLG